MLDHPEGCDGGVCEVRAHKILVQPACGCEVLMLFCGCEEPAFILDVARGWWVHDGRGWSTRAWYEAAGSPAPEHLAGLRPAT